MIHYIRGILIQKNERFIVVDVHDIGYKIFVSNDTMLAIGQVDTSIFLHIYEIIREEAHDLYGFVTETELNFFEMLLSVSGIGPKSALGILNVAQYESLIKAIASNDTAFLTKVSGIGRKTAEKIVLELRDKLAAHKHEGDEGSLREESDAVEALHSLGYSVAEARDVLKKVSDDTMDTNARIKKALKLLSSK
ncbi:MAG: Holliday junction branch migration protein RuvA [Candidatus Pacebacteria bacterium]|nr:Holliday junction branch migration protein RuvA [Candidatus Paceibacterota bacterium]